MHTKQCFAKHVVIPEVWVWDHDGVRLQGLGNHELLARPMTAFFASRACPASAIRAGLAWALEQVRAGTVVIGGFHSPLERSVLKVLQEAGSPVVVVLARPIVRSRLPQAWTSALGAGRMAVASASDRAVRLTSGQATTRNQTIACLADSITAAYANLGGALHRQIDDWVQKGKMLEVLVRHPHPSPLPPAGEGVIMRRRPRS